MQDGFIHFIHSDHSSVHGTSKIKEYIKSAQENNIKGLVLVDQDSIGMAVSLFGEAKGTDILPILGVNLRLQTDEVFQDESDIVLIAKTNNGYKEIKNLVSEAYMHGQSKLWKKNPNISKEEELKNEEYRKSNKELRPTISYDIINQEENLIISFGSNNDFVSNIVDDYIGVKNQLIKIQNKTKNQIVLSISVLAKDNENIKNNKIIQLGKELNIPCIINQDVKFSSKELFNTHELKNSILTSQLYDDIHRKDNATPYQYLMSSSEISDLFQNVESIIDNTNTILSSCAIEIETGINYLPKFDVPVPFEAMSENDYLKKIGLEGTLRKLKVDYPDSWQSKQIKYKERLDFELGIIEGMGFPGYFLIVADFINAAKDMGVPVGPGRGSGAGSIVAYGLDITDIDPIKYSLFFERFLNPERVSMPDFDIDFSKSVFKDPERSDFLFTKYGIPLEKKNIGRDDVIAYVAKKYNNPDNKFMSVTQIITEGKLGGKGAIKDAARALNLSLPFVEGIIKDFKDDQGISVDDMLEGSIILNERYKNEPTITMLFNNAKKLEGRKKSSGVHAGGVIIAPGEITKYSAIQCEPDGSKVVTQYDKDYSEAVGLVKFDFLGLETLTVINTALRYIRNTTSKKIDIRNIPLDDKKTFELLQSAETRNIFQLESAGMRELVKRLHPTNFTEISALVALYRPGPLESGMADKFVEGKFNEDKIELLHEDLNEILKETYGTMIYQEQVQQAAQKLAGYTLGAADELRRAMGKKKLSEMLKHKKIFITKASEQYRDSIKKKTLEDKGLECDINFKDFDEDVFINTLKLTNYYIAERGQIEVLLKHININSSDEEDFFENLDQTNEDGFVKIWESRITKLLKSHYKNKLSVNRIIMALRNFTTFNYIFSAIEKFAAYGFNKSHSVSYAKVTYETLYLKANHPVEYMAAEFSSNLSKTEKIGEIIQESRRMKLKILPPDINKSNLEFIPEKNSDIMCIRYGLGAIKGLGEKEIDKILIERDANGSFLNFNDYFVRIGRSLNKRSKECLAYSGVLDSLVDKEVNRADVLNEMLVDYSLNTLIKSFSKENIIDDGKILSLFEKINNFEKPKQITKPELLLLEKNGCLPERMVYNTITDFSDKKKLSYEYSLLGAYISNHPLYINNNFREAGKLGDIKQIKTLSDELEDYCIAGVILGTRNFIIKKEGKNLGRTIAKITIDDAFGQTDVTIFPDEYDAYKDVLVVGNVIACKVDTKVDDFGLGVSCNELLPLDPRTEVKAVQKRRKRKYTKKNKNNNLYASMKKS
jgi:DNA-directed DNA polymerase III PolC